MPSIKGLIKNKEVKNAGWIIFGRVSQMVLSFIISIITTRYLGPSNFGLINYATAYVTLFTSLCTLGINFIIIKEFNDNPDSVGEIIGTSIGLRFLSSLLSIAIIVLVVFFVDNGDRTTVAVAFFCSLALSFQVVDSFNYWFQAQYKSKVTSIATLIAYVLTSVYRIILFVTRKSVVWFAFATSVDFICLGVLQFISYRRYGGPKLSFCKETGKRMLSKSYHYILSGTMVAIYGQTDKFMLKHMLDEAFVGYYSLATTINTMWVFVLTAIIDSTYPTIVSLHKTNYDAYKRKNRQLYNMVIYISIFVSIIFVLFGRLFIELVYGNEYIYSVEPLKIVTWYTIFSYLGVARNAWIVCENKQKYLKYMYASAAVINICLNLVFIPIMKASGAALASLITQICTCFILPLFIKDMRPNAKLMGEALLWKETWK